MPSPLPLTRNQREVYELHQDGVCNAEIAATLEITLSATKGRLQNARRKLGFPPPPKREIRLPYRPLEENVRAVAEAYRCAPIGLRDTMLVRDLLNLVLKDVGV